MKNVLLPFLKKLLVTSLVLAVLMFIAFAFFLPDYFIPVLPFLLVFVFGFTYISFYYLVKTAGSNFGKFVRKIMIVTILRLFIYILIIVLYAAFIKNGMVCFIISFGVFYLIFTSLEVYELLTGAGKLSFNHNKI